MPSVLRALAKDAQAEWCHSSSFSIAWVLQPVYCSLQGWKERWKRPLLLNSASDCVFPPVLCCDFFSLCVGYYLDMALVACVWMQALFISVSPMLWEFVFMMVEFVCFCLPVCIHLCVHVLFLCLMYWVLRMLLPVPVFMQPMFVCIYASQLCMCIPVSMLS